MQWPPLPVLTLVGILTFATGCDKDADIAARDSAAGGGGSVAATDLSRRPDVLFFVFGDTADARIVPVALIGEKGPEPISLTTEGWHSFDSLYFAPGTELFAYRAGAGAGQAVITRAMWKGQDAPLYSIPGCRATIPLAGVSVRPQTRESFSIELLASTREMAQPQRPAVQPRVGDQVGLAAVRRAAVAAGIDTSSLDRRNFIIHSLATGAGSGPTVVASYLEGAGRRSQAAPSGTHLLVVSDTADAARSESYVHVGSGGPGTEYRRYVDRLDVDGDGVDELLLEGWRVTGEAFPLILKWSDGRWREAFRGRDSWCLDRRRR
jgi:hypothetical protein